MAEKKGNIAPIFKNRRMEDPGNYKLVSFMPAPGRITEKIIWKRC